MTATNSAADRLIESTCTQTSAAVERMRSELKTAYTQTPSPDQVRAFCDGLLGVKSVDEICEATGFTIEQMGNVAAKLGTHLAHTQGKPGVDARDKLMFVSEISQVPLFLAGAPPLGKRRDRATEKKPRKHRNNPVPADVLVLHDSWDDVLRKRDFKSSLAAIVSAAPCDTQIVRFIARTWRQSNTDITSDHVTILWKFTELGRLSDIDKVSNDPGFMTAMVEAFDLLETARRDAMDSLLALLSPAPLSTPLTHIRNLEMVWPKEVDRMKIFASQTATTLTIEQFDRERSKFRQQIAETPDTYIIAHIGELQATQVIRIAEMNGIDTNRSEKEAEIVIREGLEARDLSRDIDLLLPEGLRAFRAEKQELFWKACKLYAAGNQGWRDILEVSIN